MATLLSQDNGELESCQLCGHEQGLLYVFSAASGHCTRSSINVFPEIHPPKLQVGVAIAGVAVEGECVH